MSGQEQGRAGQQESTGWRCERVYVFARAAAARPWKRPRQAFGLYICSSGVATLPAHRGPSRLKNRGRRWTGSLTVASAVYEGTKVHWTRSHNTCTHTHRLHYLAISGWSAKMKSRDGLDQTLTCSHTRPYTCMQPTITATPITHHTQTTPSSKPLTYYLPRSCHDTSCRAAELQRCTLETA